MTDRFKKSDFTDIWDHLYAAVISPSICKKIAERANQKLEKWQSEDEKLRSRSLMCYAPAVERK